MPRSSKTYIFEKIMDIKELDFSTIRDPRGCLTAIEAEQMDIPIDVKRIFYMHHVSDDRGGHAHIDTDQVIFAVSGSFKLRLTDGRTTREFLMNDCTKGVYVPRLTFTDLYEFSADAVCMVLANTHYDMGRSLRSYDAYISYLEKNHLL